MKFLTCLVIILAHHVSFSQSNGLNVKQQISLKLKKLREKFVTTSTVKATTLQIEIHKYNKQLYFIIDEDNYPLPSQTNNNNNDFNNNNQDQQQQLQQYTTILNSEIVGSLKIWHLLFIIVTLWVFIVVITFYSVNSIRDCLKRQNYSVIDTV